MQNLLDQVFGNLTVKAYVGTRPRANDPVRCYHLWSCGCTCGTKGFVTTSVRLLASNRPTRSCGCLLKEQAAKNCIARSRTHGESSSGYRKTETPEYRCWKSIKTRCYNQNYKQYADYGGRGIRVCNRWYSSFESFLADMGRRPSDTHSIQRRENDGDYTPDNCYWATDPDQRRNKRTTVRIEIDGVIRPLVEWREVLGVAKSTYCWRRRQGWSQIEALLGKG